MVGLKHTTSVEVKHKLSNTLRNWLPILHSSLSDLGEAMSPFLEANPVVEVRSGYEEEFETKTLKKHVGRYPLIQHIPEPNFKMVRYYGAYARRTKKTFKSYLQSSIEQTKLTMFGVKIPERVFHCPYCGGNLEFVMYMDKGPPEIQKSQRELIGWISVNSKN